MTLTFTLALNKVKVNHHVKYLSQRLFRLKLTWNYSTVPSPFSSSVLTEAFARVHTRSIAFDRVRARQWELYFSAAAWSIACLQRSDHITDALAGFHWLRAPERTKFKLAVIVYELSTVQQLGTSPICSALLLICRWEVDFSYLLPDLLTSTHHDSSLSVIAHFLQPDHDCGTGHLNTFSLPRNWQHFVENWKICTFFDNWTHTLFSSCIATVDLEITAILAAIHSLNVTTDV